KQLTENTAYRHVVSIGFKGVLLFMKKIKFGIAAALLVAAVGCDKDQPQSNQKPAVAPVAPAAPAPVAAAAPAAGTGAPPAVMMDKLDNIRVANIEANDATPTNLLNGKTVKGMTESNHFKFYATSDGLVHSDLHGNNAAMIGARTVFHTVKVFGNDVFAG